LSMKKTVSFEEAYNSTKEYFCGIELATDVWIKKYGMTNKSGELVEKTPDDMHKRIAKEFARIEQKYPNPLSEETIYEYLKQFGKIIPGGSANSGIGNKYQISSLSNCFSLPSPHDSYGGICYTDELLVQASKRRAGSGINVSTLRPKGLAVSNAAKTTDGIVVFLKRFSNSIREVGQSGRRGAALALLSVHHPEIKEFIKIKNDRTQVTGLNLSVQITDEFMNAVIKNKEYELRFPVNSQNPIISRMIPAREIWDLIVESAWDAGEPGLLFWDTIIRNSPADVYKDQGFETIGCNACSELTMGAFGACVLLSLNLFGFVKNPFEMNSSFDWEHFSVAAQHAQRLVDDLVDLEEECVEKIIQKINSDPEPDLIKKTELSLWENVKKTNHLSRRTGLGITALADVLASLGIRYGSQESLEFTENIYKTLATNSYRSSIQMAKERGCFPICDVSKEKEHVFIKKIVSLLPQDTQEDYLRFGRRNIANLTTPPTGTISLLAKLTPKYFGVSSGIEPVFQVFYKRRKKISPNDNESKIDFVDSLGDKWTEFEVKHPGYELWSEKHPGQPFTSSPYYKATTSDLDWNASVDLVASAIKFTDHNISKTTNLPNDITKKQVSEIYLDAWKKGLKGITVYRDGCRDGVLITNKKAASKREAQKRPKELLCDIHLTTVQGEKWTIFIGILNGKPYEIIGGLSSKISLPKRVKNGKIVKHNGSDNPVARYDLHFDFEIDAENETIIRDIANIFDNKTHAAFTRMISLSLRHEIPIQFLVEQLEKGADKDDEGIYGFSRVVGRVLKKYIKEGTKSSSVCPSCCQESLVYKEGCITCLACGHSKC
jgi:ribonucleoside-diphosphate reductase alpha chain